MEFLQDILAAVGVVINGLPQGILALTFGFASIPTAFAFLVGAVGNTAIQSVAPISFQAETIALAGTMGENLEERLSMVFFGAFGMALIGAFGLMQTIIDFIGENITYAMMAGVGLMLAKISLDMLKRNVKVGTVSFVTAIIVYVFTQNLVYTIVASVVLSSIAAHFFHIQSDINVKESRKLKLTKFKMNKTVLRGALAMICLNIGSNISFGMITGSMAAGSGANPVNVNGLSIISSLADMASSAFGGAPVESIISATGSAPHPVWSGVIMMALMAVILLCGLLPKIGKYVPGESIAGFLFILGAFVTVPGNAAMALSVTPIVGGVTMTVTALTDPFLGMLSGIVLKFILPLLGVTL